jgi:hypothetical protein
MPTNVDRYKEDLESLIAKGERLEIAMQRECFPGEIEGQVEKQLGEQKAKAFLKELPSFSKEYQAWYSEAKMLIKQLLPDRLADFARHYEKPKPRKDISYENYRIEDYLQGLTVTRWDKQKLVGIDAAIPHFRQQLAILKSVKARFESTLFDIRQLVQADLFDSELEASKELAKHKFGRAAGAVAGVVLERHLKTVCEQHNLKVTKKNPTIGDLNNALKEVNILDLPQWRFVQHLADIRNLCDHSKSAEPSPGQIDDLIAGVTKITKTVF